MFPLFSKNAQRQHHLKPRRRFTRRYFTESTPSVFCLILTLFCCATPVFSQNLTIEAADKALESAKHDTTNAVPYATALRDLWQAYRQYLVAGKTETPDTLSVLLLNQEAVYQASMDSLVKASTAVKGKTLPKFWKKVEQKERFLYQDMIESLNTIDTFLLEKDKDSEALPNFELKQVLLNKLDSKEQYFICISRLAITNASLGKYEAAQSILEKAIGALNQELTRYESLSKKDRDKTENKWLAKAKGILTDLTARLCNVFMEKGNFNSAVLNGKKGIALMKECLKDKSYKNYKFDDPYFQLALVCYHNYKLDSALLIVNEGFTLYPKISREYKMLLAITFLSYYNKGDMVNYEKAVVEYGELAKDDDEKVTAKQQRFILYFKIGQYSDAAKWLDEFTESALKRYGKNTTMGDALPNDMKANFYQDIGEFDKAKQCIDKAIAIKQNLGLSTNDIATSESHLADIYDGIGQYDKALAIREQIHKNKFVTSFENSKGRINFLARLGSSYIKFGKLDSARLYYEKCCAILKAFGGTKTVSFIVFIHQLGFIEEIQHDYTKAEKWYQEGQRCADSVELVSARDKGTWLLMRARILRKRGKLSESLEKSEKSLVILRGSETSDFYRKAVLNRALLHAAQQQNAAAVDSLQSLSQNIQKRIVKEFAYLSEQEKVAFMTMLDADFFGTMQAAYAHLYATGEAARSGALFYNTVLLQKELSLVDTRSLKRKAANLNDTLLFAELFKLNAFEEQSKSDKPIPTAERARLTTETAQIKADLEKTYPKLFEKEGINANWQSVQKQLKPDEIAIEFADVLNNDDDTTSIRNYYALVIKADSKYPSVIPLFEEKELTKLLDDSRFYNHDNKTGAPILSDEETVKRRYNKENGKKFYDLIWQALENSGLLRGVQTVHFAPSGLLNRVAFAALPVGGNLDKLLLQTYQLRQYNTTRALVETTPRRMPSAKDLVAFGNIQYGNCSGDTSKSASVETIPLEKADGLVARSALFLDSTTIHWQDLPNSKRELANIEKSHKKYQPTATFTAFTGYNASEARFKTLGTHGTPSPSHLFISTHGFGNPTNYPESRYASAALHRAGVVMATANWTTECHLKRGDLDDEDGILTAYEIAQLNLSNTELVVLSGCQTGLGDIWGREGVFGLTRGFKLAGVNHLIASLWSVPDADTAEFMSAFYDLYLSGKNINAAFEETQKVMQQKQSAYSWAAWVLIR